MLQKLTKSIGSACAGLPLLAFSAAANSSAYIANVSYVTDTRRMGGKKESPSKTVKQNIKHPQAILILLEP